MARRTTAEWRAVVFKHPNVSAPCKLTLLFLAEYMKANGQVSIPRDRIAATLSAAERSIDYHLKEARENGLLDLIAAGRKGRTAVYTRVFPSGHSAQDIARNPPAHYTEDDSNRLRANDRTDPRNQADLSQIARNTLRTTTTEPGTPSHLDSSISDEAEGPSSPQATASPGERATPLAADDDEDQSSNPAAAAAPPADQGEGSQDWQRFNSLTTEEKLKFRKFAGAKSVGLYARSLDQAGDLGLKLAEWRAEEQAAAKAEEVFYRQDLTVTSSEWDPGVDCWDMAEYRNIEPGGEVWNDLLANFRREHPKGQEYRLNIQFCDYLDEYYRRVNARFCRSCGRPTDEPHEPDCTPSNRPKYCFSCRIDLWDGTEHTAECAEHKITQGAA